MESKLSPKAEQLEAAAGYVFQNAALLDTALTHTSFVKGEARHAHGAHNERLEFLGDAVLELTVSDYLYHKNPAMAEGVMTRTRALLVREEALFEAAKRIALSDALKLGHGEDLTGGRQKPSVVSDAFEALIGAIYLDGGMESARKFIMEFVVEPHIEEVLLVNDKDFKTRLQEYVQSRHLGKLTYVLTAETGPEHHKTFAMDVLLDGRTIGSGTGANKQTAGQAAAAAALAEYQRNGQEDKCD